MTKKNAFLVFFLFTYVWKSVKILLCLPEDKRKPPAGDRYSGEPHESGKIAQVFVSADTRKKSLFW
jgi:hypothetical protein